MKKIIQSVEAGLID